MTFIDTRRVLGRTTGLPYFLTRTGRRLNARKLISAACLGTTLLTSACQTVEGLSNDLGIQQVSKDDACGQASTELREAQGYFERSIIQGAVIGAVGGAILGGILGGGDGALAGAAVGGAAGAGGGYLAARQNEASDRSELNNTVYQDAQSETGEIVRALAAFNRVRDCRLARSETIKQQFATGQLTREQAQKMLDVEKRRYSDDIVVVKAIAGKIDERHQEFVTAVDTMAEDNPEASALLARAQEAEENEWKNPDAVATTGSAVSQDMVVASTNLNVRAEPSTTGAKVGLLEGGTAALRTGPDQDGWTPVQLANGSNGFVATQYLSGYEGSAPAVNNQSDELTLASVTRSVSSDADTETRTVAVLYEGREKRIELDRLTQTAEQEENTAFSLDG
ncbi:SH3 domain-containing protein [Hwanghaeella grinnelliae]|uniref:SH3 domain-containing protein n=1 Tax=Hwanghaeella grinnelliae TaxID=2500179 RepID=A0A437QHH7_9PROT|nr:SH3 domain-containing protein [Hwanghaeella grinnelliae]RVU33760.1 SH3 domain-containing protein [Hwanghaeella grinnelliae]